MSSIGNIRNGIETLVHWTRYKIISAASYTRILAEFDIAIKTPISQW